MLHEASSGFEPVNGVNDLNALHDGQSAEVILREALALYKGEITLVSSFGAESAVLLHLVAQIDPTVPVLMVDTLMLFKETLDYQKQLAEHLGLTDVRHILPDAAELKEKDPWDALHLSNTEACCSLRKVVPLQRALAPFAATISGRKRYQSGRRAEMDVFEVDRFGKVKINPLADWTPEDIKAYMLKHNLPSHPLVAKGYASIGCAPCTTPVREGEDPRAGRWRGEDKDECGIHYAADGSVERTKPMPQLINRHGFVADDWPTDAPSVAYDALVEAPTEGPFAVDFANDADPILLEGDFHRISMIRVPFPSSSDGRGFSVARQLRMLGYRGRLRAVGHVLSDQFRGALRVGFDEVEIPSELAARQPEEHWKAVTHDLSYIQQITNAA
jgi:phosphoadenosine phosphosulfate reductase